MIKLTTARTTGLIYLGLALTGFFAFLFARQHLYVDGNAFKTSTNLVDNEMLARWGIAAEVALVGFQALAAVWFYKLFRKKDSFGAGLIAIFGMVNAGAILIASALWLVALNAAVSGGAMISPAGDQAATAQLLFGLHESIWLVSGLFFGLWLLPMGYMASRYNMPRALTYFLYVGGVGYILSTFVLIVAPGQTSLAEILPIPATIGEFWIIGYLLFKPVEV